jgi:hypothetical protein
MKKIIIFLISAITLFSCEKNFDIEQQGITDMDGLFGNDPVSLKNGVNAIYNELFDRGRNIEYYALFEHLGTDIAGVNLYNIDHGDPPRYDVFDMYDSRLSPSNGVLDYLVKKEYKIINIAVSIIYYGSQGEANLANLELQKAVAEAKFFYSLAYYELFMTFGNIPLIKEPITEPKNDFERTPVEEIIPFLEGYLLEAIEVLDENSTTARVSKNACRMLLAKIYMAAAGDVYQEPCAVAGPTSEYWQKAEQMAQDVISSSQFQLITTKKGPYCNDQDTIPGPVNWAVAGFPNMREGLQQKYMVRHPNYYSCLFQNGFEGPEDGNTETIFHIAFQGQALDEYGRNYIRCVWVSYSLRANGITRDMYQGGRSWGRARATDYMAFDIWDYKDNPRKKNWDSRKYASCIYTYYFNNETALANHFLYVRRFSNPSVAVDTLKGWKVLTAATPSTHQGQSGKITNDFKIMWGKNGSKYYTADLLVVEDDSVFVQPFITGYPSSIPTSAKYGVPYTDLWFPKRVYYQGDTIWGPRPGDEFFPRTQTDWQSLYVGSSKQSYWVRNSAGSASSKAEVSNHVGATGGPGDIILFRLAEAYLIAGEAEFHQGGAKLQEAADHFNVVRQRAFNNGDVPVEWEIAPGDLTIDWILDERGRELFTEEYRWFEIKRLNKWDRVIANNPNSADFNYATHRLRPIPIALIDLNQGNPAGMYQNPQ